MSFGLVSSMLLNFISLCIVHSYSIAVLLAAESSDRSAGVEFHWHMVCGMQ